MTDHNPQRGNGAYDLLRRGDVLAFARYVVVGGAQNAVFYGLTLGLLWSGFKAWQALALLYPLSVTVSFLANRSWSFADRKKSPLQFRNYVLVYVIVYPLATCFTWLQERASVPSWLASLITTVVGAIAIFFALNYWVFRNAPADEGAA